MSVAITPTATDSKVLVIATLNVGNNTNDRWSAYQLLRGSTAISIGDADGSKTQASVGNVRMTATGSQNFVDNKNNSFFLIHHLLQVPLHINYNVKYKVVVQFLTF